jgi:hypothetical protein
MTNTFDNPSEDFGRLDTESCDVGRLNPEREQLRDIAGRIEDFLVAQIHRLESAVQDSPPVAEGSADVELIQRELSEEQRRWETERAREVERIKTESAQLVQAWERVECEQRELLALRGATRGNVRSLQTLRNADTQCAREADTVPYSGQDRYREVVEDEALSPESAVLQFQQLRREIQRHSQQHR